MNRTNVQIGIVWLIVLLFASAIACGSKDPPSEATLKELALLSETGNADAKGELSKLDATVVVPDRSGEISTHREAPPPDAVAEELARLASSGDSEAANAMNKVTAFTKQYEEKNAAANREMDTVALLASSTAVDDHVAERRSEATEELRTEFDNGELDYEKAVRLVDIIAPDAAINERRDAARRLADLSEEGGEWNAERRLLAANELSRLVTGDSLEAEKRIKAARELVTKLDAGDLEPREALDLMDRISPHSDIKKRAQALGSIARRFGEDGGNWDADDMMEFADELHTATFGDSLNYEKRGRAAVDLAGEGIKRIGGDSYSDKEINDAGRVIKEAAFGDSDSLRGAIEDILGD